MGIGAFEKESYALLEKHLMGEGYGHTCKVVPGLENLSDGADRDNKDSNGE